MKGNSFGFVVFLFVIHKGKTHKFSKNQISALKVLKFFVGKN